MKDDELRVRINRRKASVLNSPGRFEDRFWELVEQSRDVWNPDKSDGTQAAQARRIRELLAPLSAKELVLFARERLRLLARAYRNDLWDAAFMASGFCSDDGFLDFRSWLLSMGRRAYEQVLADPDALVDVLDVPGVEFPGFEGFGDACNVLYEQRTGRCLPDLGLVSPSKPTGERHRTADARERAYPRLFERYEASSVRRPVSLDAAALKGWRSQIEALLAAGADPDEPIEGGECPLFWAATRGHLPVVQSLLAAGADVNGPTHPESTPLSAAVRNGHEAVVSFLLDNGADPDPVGWDGTPLFLAASTFNPGIVQILVSNGASVRLAVGPLGATALMEAASNGDEETTRVLLAYGADPMIIDNSGATALIAAASSGDKRTVQLLLVHGADPMIIDNEGCSAWGCADEAGYAEVAALFPPEARKPNPTDE